MKHLFTILAILFATSIYSQEIQEDTVSVDSYTTQRDSPDSTGIEMTWEEMEELWAELEEEEEREETECRHLRLAEGAHSKIARDGQGERALTSACSGPRR